MRATALVIALAASMNASSAVSASAREQHTVKGTGVLGHVTLDDGHLGAGLQGWVKDTASDGACAELWMDFTTKPHHHFDAYAIRTCGPGKNGLGRYNKVRGKWGWTIRGVRTAACTYWPNGTRKCTRQWPYDSARANTFNLQVVGGGWRLPGPGKDLHCGESERAQHNPPLRIQSCAMVHDSPSGAYVQGVVIATNAEPHESVNASGITDVYLDGSPYRSDNCGTTVIPAHSSMWCYGKTTWIRGNGRDVHAKAWARLNANTLAGVWSSGGRT